MMGRLPLCPHCGARFFYRDVKNSLRRKTGVCPHCKKAFLIRYRVRAFGLYAVLFVLFIGCNVFLLRFLNASPLFLIGSTALAVGLSLLLFPFAAAYRKP